MARAHGTLLAHDVGELVGVSGTTIGQWARRGYIASSQRETEPRLYSVEDVAEAAIVSTLLERGVRHADVRRTVERLRGDYGAWPLSEAHLAVTSDTGRPRIVLRERDGAYVLSPRGWQLMAAPPRLEDVRLRLRRTPAGSDGRRP
jgi:DNA-binding transcriptional MerR regulator